MYTDEDFSGLMKVADAGLRKQAANYGNMPELTTGNVAADMGLYLVPGVGEAMAGYDAVRNYADTWSDLKRGKLLAAAGNLGSGVLNTLFAIPAVGYLGRLGKVLFRGGKAVSRGGMGLGKANARLAREALKREGTKVVRDASGKAVNSPLWHPFATHANRQIRSAYAPNRSWMDAYRNFGTAMRSGSGKYIPKFRYLIGGQLAGEAMKAYDDARYEGKRMDYIQNKFDNMNNLYSDPSLSQNMYQPWSVYNKYNRYY